MSRKIQVFGPRRQKALLDRVNSTELLRAMDFFIVNGRKLHGEKSLLQAFINCIEPNSYVVPHRHRDYVFDNKQLKRLQASSDNINVSRQTVKAQGSKKPRQLLIERWELFVVLRGAIRIITFQDDGIVDDTKLLSSGETSVGIVPPDTYHTVVAMEKDTLLFELKNGWYDPKRDKQTPDWAPDSEKGALFLQWLKRAKINQKANKYSHYLKREDGLGKIFLDHKKGECQQKNLSYQCYGLINNKKQNKPFHKKGILSSLTSCFK